MFFTREEAQTKLQMLQEKNTSVEENHAHQVRELDRQLYKDIERIKFLTVKGQHRIMDELEMKKEQKEMERRRMIQETLIRHKKLFEQLKEFYNEDVDNMCAMYLKAEEENYALFNYVNEVNCEVPNVFCFIKHFLDYLSY